MKVLEGLNMFNGTNLTFNSDVDQDTYICLVHMKDPLLIDASSPSAYNTRK